VLCFWEVFAIFALGTTTALSGKKINKGILIKGIEGWLEKMRALRR
jgi:hypothetical protein